MTRVTFLHTSPAAIAPLADFYKANAPDLEITNVLDDGLLRLFRAGDEQAVARHLDLLLRYSIDQYQAELALVTCSSVSRKLVAGLAATSPIPVLKIDEALAQAAVSAGTRLGILITFPPTQSATESLIREVAADRGVEVTLDSRLFPPAYDALLTGHFDEHDRILIDAVRDLAATGVDAIVLAQVSMARILPQIPKDITVPVLSSLPVSLDSIRAELARR